MASSKKTTTKKKTPEKKNTKPAPKKTADTKKESTYAHKPPTKKRTSNTKTVSARDEVQDINRAMLNQKRRQRAAIALLASAALMFFIIIIKGESVWTAIHTFFFGIFGICAFLIPVFLTYIAVILAMDKPFSSVKSKLLGSVLVVVLLGGIIHSFTVDDALDFSEQMSYMWSLRGTITFRSAGVLGAFFGGLFMKMFGTLGAQIFLIIALIVVIMFMSGTTLVTLYNLIKPEKKDKEIPQKREEGPDNNKITHTKPRKKYKPVDFEPDKDELSGLYDDTILIDDLVGNAPEGYTDSVDTKKSIDEIIKNAVEVRTPEPKTEKKELPKEKKGEIFTVPGEPDTPRIKPYIKPTPSCLETPKASNAGNSADELRANAQTLVTLLNNFGVQTKLVDISRGPSVTRYELQPASGVKISKITGLADDIALGLASSSGVRIEAPIPNKSAVGIEVPNRNRSTVTLREIIETPQFKNAKSKLNVALGKDITGNTICADLSKMPHLLIAGTTGSGKSVCLNSMIVSLLYNATPDEVKLLMIDPKQVEFTIYNGIPHLLVPVVSDPRKATGALGWAVTEMLKRYKMFSEKNVRDMAGYNKIAETDDTVAKLPHIVIFIDELSDLMMAAPNEVEDSICRLAQMARAAGMHLVIATQRPSVNVITGVIKANIPSRISLSVSSQIDSRTILDSAGAEKLLGNGDMLFSPIGKSKPIRVQGCYLSDSEVESVVNFIKEQEETDYDNEVMFEIEKLAVADKRGASSSSDDGEEPADEMLPKAIEVVVETQMASTTMLQKKLKLGYARASRIIDDLEERGIIGPFEGSKPRKVLMSKQQWMEMNALSPDNNISLTDTHTYEDEQ